MQNYELLFIFPGTMSEDEVPALVSKVKEAIESNGGQNLTITDMGKSRLAYPIKHIRYGYFQIARFEGEGQTVVDIKAKLKLIPELLRSLISKYDASKKTEAIINFAHVGQTGTGRGDESRSYERTPERNQERLVSDIAANVKAVVVDEEASEEKKEIKSKATAKKEDKKIKLDDIDKKLDEILDMGLDKV